ncbi:hypothetical protein L1987_24490 [Smallanthus sonchifolius]|uniref:Uncharacterized protein n=1 Tax=Smallanthus sonchifolius TaxID=185202 RepID=A0ACB9IKD4_9ASTR|nr:hypothetical protein L1987_24490 [Smallanthus sonchifolius]
MISSEPGCSIKTFTGHTASNAGCFKLSKGGANLVMLDIDINSCYSNDPMFLAEQFVLLNSSTKRRSLP